MTSQSYEFCSVERINVCKKLRIISSSDFERHGTRDDGSIRVLLSCARKKEKTRSGRSAQRRRKCYEMRIANKQYKQAFCKDFSRERSQPRRAYRGIIWRLRAQHVPSRSRTCSEHGRDMLRARSVHVALPEGIYCKETRHVTA